MTRIRSLISGALMALVAVAAMVTMAILATPASAEPAKPRPVPAAEAPDSGVAPLHCSGHAHSNKDTRTGQFFDSSNVNIRRFPHVASCAISDGQGQLSHQVDYHCFAAGDSVTRNGVTYSTWTYLRDITTNVSGWVSDAFLDLNPGGFRGSLVAC